MTNLPFNEPPNTVQSELETAFIPDKDTENDIQKHIYTMSTSRTSITPLFSLKISKILNVYFEEAGVNKNLNNKMYNRHHAFVCTNNIKKVCKGVDIIREVCLC